MTPLVSAEVLAEYLGVTRGWCYEHAAELGARRLGSGPRARLRFSITEVDDRLSSCYGSRKSSPADRAPQAAPRARRRRSIGTSVELLPVKGDGR